MINKRTINVLSENEIESISGGFGFSRPKCYEGIPSSETEDIACYGHDEQYAQGYEVRSGDWQCAVQFCSEKGHAHTLIGNTYVASSSPGVAKTAINIAELPKVPGKAFPQSTANLRII